MARVSGFDDEEKTSEADPIYRGPLYKKDPDEVKRRTLIRSLTAILVILIAIAFVVINGKEEEAATVSENAKETVQKVPKGVCPKFCHARLEQRKKHHGGDLLKASDLLEQFETAKSLLIEDLREKYGSYYDEIMLKDGKWRKGFTGINSNGISEERFRRKLKIKLLEMQEAIREENSHLEGCNCNEASNSGRHRRLDPKTLTLPEVPLTYTKFVWATGGHSAAAGHGNLYNESYTAFMERAVKPVFQSVGIDFEGRNYAMGGMRSAPEYALCQESIFGLDADVASWDFGMTDAGPHEYKQRLYMSRGGVHPNRPVLVGVHIDDESRINIMKEMEEFGLTTFYLKNDVSYSMTQSLPDMLGMTQEQIDKVPDYVRYFKCKEQIEKGDPGCDANKYNEALCSNRLHKASWHPGWKTMALDGYLMAFFLLDNLHAAIEEITEDNQPRLLFDLKAKEDADYEKFREYKIPKQEIPNFLDSSLVEFIDPDMIHRQPLICHTALTPSQNRYNGILTETSEKIGMVDYEKGIPFGDASEHKSEDGLMRLVWDPSERGPSCPVLTKVDFKDFFYANELDGWTTLKIPNDSEENVNKLFTEPKGLIMICFILCDWGKCPSGDIREEAIEDGQLKMKINGVSVVALSKAAECGFAKHQDGYFFPAENNKFTIEVLVEPSTSETKQYTRITSIVVF